MTGATIPLVLRRMAAERPSETAYLHRSAGRWAAVSWRDNEELCRRVSRALMSLGVRHGDRVAIVSQSRIEWVQCDLGIAGCGAVTVGIYPTSPPSECAYVLDHSDSGVAFFEDWAQIAKLASLRPGLPHLKWLVALDGSSDEASGVLSWEQFLARADAVPDGDLDACIAAVGPDDLAAVVYTSGTTGIPKGAMLTHRGVLFSAESAASALALGPGKVYLLILPLAHVFARLTVHLCMSTGNVVAFAESLARISENMKTVRPHFLAGVPRMFEKIQDRIRLDAKRAGGFRSRVFAWSLDAGMRASRLEREGRAVPFVLRARRALARRLVFRKIHAALGGRVEFLISGAAPLDVRVAEFFHACGILILEGIGMTENASFSNVNRPGRFRFGTVGPAGPGIETRIAEDGEILVRGPNVMRGYFKDPDATRLAIDGDGWLHTGDVGHLDADGFLTVVDRKKDLIITSGGKNVAPQRIERALASSSFIARAVAFGDRRKYITALVTLDADAMRSWAERAGRAEESLESLARDEEVLALIDAEVDAVNRTLAPHEVVKSVRILPGDFSVEAGELTPTLKVRRKVVVEKYRSLIDEMYR